MFFSRLLAGVESHHEVIAATVVQRLRRNADTQHVAALREEELFNLAEETVRRLGAYLFGQDHPDLIRRYEELGRKRYREGVPLYESVRSVQILKETTGDAVRNQGYEPTTMEIYAEEELERMISRFFDDMVFHLVKGYELSMSPPAQSRAASQGSVGAYAQARPDPLR